jgi:hypothetical protein
MKRRASSTNDPTDDIVALATNGIPAQVAATLPKRLNLVKTVRRIRAGNAPMPPIPRSLALMVIADASMTIPNEGQEIPFLLHDAGQDAGPNRFLIFSTQKNLDLLAQSDMYYSDGTFGDGFIPFGFKQLYSIHAAVLGTIVPLVYMLLPKEDMPIYRAVIRKLKELKVFRLLLHCVEISRVECSGENMSAIGEFDQLEPYVFRAIPF